MKYFIWNKQLDFDRGLYEKCEYRKGWLCADSASDGSGGAYISRIVDSLERETRWHRATMDVKGAGDMAVRISFYSSDLLTFNSDKGEESIPEYLMDPDISVYQKKAMLKPYLKKSVYKSKDVLLHECRGQYLWFIAELMPQGRETAGIRNIRIDFDVQSWMQHLPEVYRKSVIQNDFLERFLSVFQTEYQDLEEAIRKSYMQIESHTMPETAQQEEFLRWLAGWIGITDTNVWNRERLHKLLINAPELFRLRGTRKGVSRIIEIFWGIQPIIVENFELEKYRSSQERYESMVRIYGSDKSSFTLMLPERLIDSKKKEDILMLLMESMMPAHMSIKTVPLKEAIYLGSYTYLGVNSKVSQLNELSLYGQEYLSFTKIAEKPGGKV